MYSYAVAKFRVPDWREKVDSFKELSYRPARLHRLAVRYDNPMPESTLSPSQGLWIWPQISTYSEGYSSVVLLDMRFHSSSAVDPELCIPDPDSASQDLPDPNPKLGICIVKKVYMWLYVTRMKCVCALSTKISTRPLACTVQQLF